MASNLEAEAAQCRQMATEYKWRAEQEIRLFQRAFYFDLHRQWLRMAIVCEIEAESLGQRLWQGARGVETHPLG
jgi:hypothetical protein